ncbi:hypothetical protein IFM89_032935 [Coptis chinensis]|uniref:HMA domain-containing protein n=1 Tax=Coptis chinensis TaxID=261450 RepID=A0A835I4M3_9MAGN|nr:hypothetical protein IFM89_032935 [Coptis chinensis]
MGVAGTLEYLSSLLSSNHKKSKKNKLLQTVELKVSMDCDGCELKVKKTLSSLKGVKSVDINRKQQKVTVTGYVDAKRVLKKAQSTGKKSEIWPYVPYNLVVQPYVAQVYDKKAPPGYVRKIETTGSSTMMNHEDPYIAMFSDDNPNSCSIIVITKLLVDVELWTLGSRIGSYNILEDVGGHETDINSFMYTMLSGTVSSVLKKHKMGIGRTMEYFSALLHNSHKSKTKRNRFFQTVELKVRMDCDGCELRVKKALSSMKGVKAVHINRKQQKVTINGYIDANKVLKKVKSTGKKAEIWPYVPYNLVVHPYMAQVYDKKAPPGYVRNVETTGTSTMINQEDPYITLFSDENPNSCFIM